MKIVVFDLDETLGYFTEFGIFWDSLTYYLKNKNKTTLGQSDFDDILDLFPEFLRPNIINILNYLKTKKESKCCHKMMIYTNNNGPKEWATHILRYFEAKINFKLVDQIIAAFKVNGKHVEICRTTHNKTHNDLIKCTKIPESAEICFLDDTFYPEMSNDNIYYINVKPYYYDLEIEYMIQKFKESKIGVKLINGDTDFDNVIMGQIKKYRYDYIQKNPKEYELDKIIGKQIINHLHEFFAISKKNKTIKNRNKYRNKTLKKF
jgi:hypothetical protein